VRRRSSAVLVVGGLIAFSVTGTGAAGAAAHAHHPGSRAARQASSVALVGSANATFRVAKGVTGAKPRRTARLALHANRSVASSIAADGNTALACTDSTAVTPLHSLRTKAKADKPLNAARFSSEGGKGFIFFCEGVSLRGSFALVAGDSLGVAQLLRRHGTWKVDARVRSPGVNESGHAHRPGWIRFRKSGTSTRYTSVSVAPRPLRGGGYLAVAVNRQDGTVAVVKGAGTPQARQVGLLTSPRLADAAAEFGTGGVAWQPGAGNRALIATNEGFAVLDLRHPARPRLERATRVGSGAAPRSLTVSPDGDHLAVVAGRRVFGYRHLHAAVAKGRKPRLQTSFRLGGKGRDAPTDVAYTANGNLVVVHGDDRNGWSVTVVQRVTRGHHAVRGSMPTTRPAASGSLSVWPAP
jgi:hypothetical protein